MSKDTTILKSIQIKWISFLEQRGVKTKSKWYEPSVDVTTPEYLPLAIQFYHTLFDHEKVVIKAERLEMSRYFTRFNQYGDLDFMSLIYKYNDLITESTIDEEPESESIVKPTVDISTLITQKEPKSYNLFKLLVEKDDLPNPQNPIHTSPTPYTMAHYMCYQNPSIYAMLYDLEPQSKDEWFKDLQKEFGENPDANVSHQTRLSKDGFTQTILHIDNERHTLQLSQVFGHTEVIYFVTPTKTMDDEFLF
jgi:hypothetical protein